MNEDEARLPIPLMFLLAMSISALMWLVIIGVAVVAARAIW